MGQTAGAIRNMADCAADCLYRGKSVARGIDRVEIAHPEPEIAAEIVRLKFWIVVPLTGEEPASFFVISFCRDLVSCQSNRKAGAWQKVATRYCRRKSSGQSP